MYITPPTGYTLQRTDEMIRLFEDELLEVPEIKEFSSNIMKEDVRLTIRLKDDYQKINKKSLIQLKTEVLRLAETVNINQISLEASESSENFRGSSGGGGMLGNSSLLKMLGMGSQTEKVITKVRISSRWRILPNI